jgi:hypothetical protein
MNTQTEQGPAAAEQAKELRKLRYWVPPWYVERGDAVLLDCEIDIGVGADSLNVIRQAETLIASLADVERYEHEHLRAMVLRQCHVFYYG